MRVRLPAGRLMDVALVASAQTVNLASVLLITRMYAPDAFGRFAALFAVAAIVGGLAPLRLDVAMTTETDAESPALIRAARTLSVTFGVVCAAVAAAAQSAAPAAGGFRPVECVLLGTTVAAMGLAATHTYAGIRRRRYRAIGVAKLANAVIQVVVLAAVGLAYPTAETLLLGATAGYGLAAAVLRTSPSGAAPRAEVRRALARHRRYVAATLPASILNSFALYLPILVATAAEGPAVVATLTLALRVGALPSALMGQSLMPILLGEISHRLRTSPASAVRRYDRALAALAVTGCVAVSSLCAVLYVGSDRLLGPEWTGVGTTLLVLAPMLIGQFAVTPLTHLLATSGGAGAQLSWDAARLLLAAACFGPAASGATSFQVCLLLYSLSMLVAYTAHALLSRRSLGTYRPPPSGERPAGLVDAAARP